MYFPYRPCAHFQSIAINCLIVVKLPEGGMPCRTSGARRKRRVTVQIVKVSENPGFSSSERTMALFGDFAPQRDSMLAITRIDSISLL
jgi:hypothetical protein